ncbi:MAG TPA: LamG-like jellyroll fold domain-containing protein [Bryobacteraceae bacterium]|nr:LamG-like jellyroll fold domain-containing protein [Bryobacteraceae bacterium]
MNSFAVTRVQQALAFALVALPFAASANTYYVATNGLDSNPGTITFPLQNIQTAVNLAHAGDTVIVRNGTYYSGSAQTCGDTCGVYHPVVSISSAGTPSAWITIKAENKWGAVLDSQLISDAYFDLHNGAAYVIIQDFDITGGYWAGINSNANAHDIIIRGNHFHNIGNRVYDPGSGGYGIVGAYVGTSAYNHTFDGNVFNNIGRLPTNPLNAYNHDHGVYLYGNNVTIQNNVFYNLTAGWGVQVSPGVLNCSIVNNTFSGANPQRDGQIEVWGNHTNLVIANNIFSSPRNYAIDSYEASEIASQTYSNMVAPGAGLIGAPIPGMIVLSNQVGVNPQFVNASAYNFHLLPSSPAIGNGAILTSVLTDFDGNLRPPFCLGAFNYMSGTYMTNSNLSGPSAYWPLNDGQGISAADLSGSGNTGTLFGGQWVTTPDTAVFLNGASQYISVPESASLEMTSSLTVSFWMNPQGVVSVDPRIIAKVWTWDVKLNGAMRYPQFSGAGKYAMINYPAAIGQWQQIAFTFSNGTVKGYVNGVPMPMLANTFTGTEVLPVYPYGVYIGTDSSQLYFADALLNEVRLYNRALSDAEVAGLYSQYPH